MSKLLSFEYFKVNNGSTWFKGVNLEGITGITLHVM